MIGERSKLDLARVKNLGRRGRYISFVFHLSAVTSSSLGDRLISSPPYLLQENLPPHLRSYPPVLLFLNSLFKSPSSTSIQPVVKSLSFDGPIFRNFVWIVLRDEAVSQSVLKEWSWGGAVGRGKRAAKEVEGVSKETQEARDAGLRVLEK